jgi:sirohydrochlorin ferrochelatase
MRQPSVVLAAHGAGDQSPANRLVESLAAKLRTALPQTHITPAFNFGTPSFADAVAAAPEGPVVVVPVMTGRGWFVDTKLPAELNRGAGSRPLTLTPPVGCVRAVVEHALDRATHAYHAHTTRAGTPPTLLVVAHGTKKSSASRSSGRRLVQLLQSRLGPNARITAAFLEEPPLLETLAPTLPGHLILLPWFLGGGNHADRDIPERLGPALARTTLLESLGDLPDLLHTTLLDLVIGNGCGWGDQCCAANAVTRASAAEVTP